MTMTIGAVICVVVIVGGIGGLGLALLFDGDTKYPPEAAEAPDLDCGCASNGFQSGCMTCMRTSCPEHQQPDHDDGFERARPLTEVGPLVVAGSDLDLSEARVNLIFAVLTLPYASDATEYAKGVVGLYVAPEVDR